MIVLSIVMIDYGFCIFIEVIVLNDYRFIYND